MVLEKCPRPRTSSCYKSSTVEQICMVAVQQLVCHNVMFEQSCRKAPASADICSAHGFGQRIHKPYSET